MVTFRSKGILLEIARLNQLTNSQSRAVQGHKAHKKKAQTPRIHELQADMRQDKRPRHPRLAAYNRQQEVRPAPTSP